MDYSALMTDVDTLTIAEFLLARIAEDEARAGTFRSMPLGEIDCPCGKRGHVDRAVNDYEVTHYVGWAPPRIDESGWVYGDGQAITETHVFSGAEADALFRSFPVSEQSRRTLAECEAKRKIVERCQLAYQLYLDGFEYEILADDVLGQLAVPYADHPDYRSDWKP